VSREKDQKEEGKGSANDVLGRRQEEEKRQRQEEVDSPSMKSTPIKCRHLGIFASNRLNMPVRGSNPRHRLVICYTGP